MDYAKLAATAKRLVDQNGALTYFQSFSAESLDVDKPWRGTGSLPVTTVEAKAVFVHPVSEGMRLGISGETEDMTKRFSGFVLVAADGVADLSGFTLVRRSGETKQSAVEFVELLKPGSTALLYIFGVKR